ncbi:MAG: HDOD domain-containing protein [Nitrosomonadales bacterium]|nr:HDOD domain-containing protein [Nitrosomonadales bacterium]
MSTTIGKKEIIAKLHQLPSLPSIVQEVIASFNDPDLDSASLANKIAQDQGLSAKVLRVANSTFYGLPRKIGSIQNAVVVLGFDTVRSLALTAGMAHTFPPSPGSLFDRQAYWQRSFRTAAISKALAKNFRQDQQMAFIAGMFCDIGQLVLDLCIPERFSVLLGSHAITDLLLLDVERSDLGFDHAEIGAEVIRLWNFPQEIERVVCHWHKPEQLESFDPLVCLVHIAASLENGASGEDLIAGLAKTCCNRMQMTWERIEACLPQPDQLEAAANLVSSS